MDIDSIQDSDTAADALEGRSCRTRRAPARYKDCETDSVLDAGGGSRVGGSRAGGNQRLLETDASAVRKEALQRSRQFAEDSAVHLDGRCEWRSATAPCSA